jgi:protein MpaA
MKTIKIGNSTLGHSIESFTSTESLKDKKILIMSGLHGDEIEGVALSTMLLNYFTNLGEGIVDHLLFAPISNPDGFSLNQRWNVNMVDLNRNWPTKDWSPKIINPRYPPGPSAESEVETKAFRQFVEESKIKFVIDLHSYKDSVLLPLFYENSDQLTSQLNTLATDLKIPIEYEQDNLGYSISGGFHTWCYENKIQNLTIELEKGIGQFTIKERYLEPIIKFIHAII